MTSQKISQEIIFEKISVRPPYYRLGELTLQGGEVHAKIIPEQPLSNELGPIGAPEVGRHLAILGSCAVGLQNPSGQRSFYLADRAKMRRLRYGYPSQAGSAYLMCRGRGEMLDKRSAVAECVMGYENKDLFEIQVHYKVLSKSLFSKLFKEQKMDMRASPRPETESEEDKKQYIQMRSNPFLDDIALCDVAIANNTLTGTVEQIDPTLCKGHFPEYPALPVAILMQYFKKSLEPLVKHMLGRSDVVFYIKETTIEAEHLAFPGEAITIKAELQNTSGDDLPLSIMATARDGRCIGKASGILTVT
ncbi:MAG: hypothetical protein QNJ97_03410 [Myxococcota bacterium]|nr:hypothetical protein [Myxococcota bacterium]